MSKVVKNLLLLVAILLSAKIAMAAVVSIADSPFSISGADSSNSGGDTSTFSGVACDATTYPDAASCRAALGASATFTPCGDGTQGNCRHPLSAPMAPKALSACPAASDGIGFCDNTNDCYAKYRDTYDASTACLDADGVTERLYVTFLDCSSPVVVGTPYDCSGLLIIWSDAFHICSSDLQYSCTRHSSMHGVCTTSPLAYGKCKQGGKYIPVHYCASDYLPAKPTCSAQYMIPNECTLEKGTTKYKGCDYPFCKKDDMTLNQYSSLKAVGSFSSYSPSASPYSTYCPSGSSSSNRCKDLYNSSKPDMVCKCNDIYTESIQSCEFPSGTTSKSAQYVITESSTYNKYCPWDTAFEVKDTFGSSSTWADRIGYKFTQCLSPCYDAVYSGYTITPKNATTCSTVGQVWNPCVFSPKGTSGADADIDDLNTQMNSFTNDGTIKAEGALYNCDGNSTSWGCISGKRGKNTVEYILNIEKREIRGYCSCPENYKTSAECAATYGSNYIGGGKICNIEGNVRKYQFCLPQCGLKTGDTITDRFNELSDVNNRRVGDPKSCTLPQPIATSTSDFYCANSSGTKLSSCYDSSGSTQYKCCRFSGESSSGGTDCSDEYLKLYAMARCIPEGYVNGGTGLCFPKEADLLNSALTSGPNAKMDCNCPSEYKTQAECTSEAADLVGAGTKCTYNGSDVANIKYEQCTRPCNSTYLLSFPNKYSENAETCRTVIKDALSQLCYNQLTSKDNFECSCPSNYKTKEQYCTDNGLDATACAGVSPVGKACSFDVSADGSTILQKYSLFTATCPASPAVVVANRSDCKDANNPSAPGASEDAPCYKNGDSETPYYICKCSSGYQTKIDGCAAADLEDASCIGLGNKCIYDINAGTALEKYNAFGKKCPPYSERPSFSDSNSCNELANAEKCYDKDGDKSGEPKYICSCPTTYVSTCATAGHILVGQMCNFEGTAENKIKYEKCDIQCQTNQTVVSDELSCPDVGGYQARTSACYKKPYDSKPSYACQCPKGTGADYQTLDEYCKAMGGDIAACKSIYVGVGAVCSYDIDAAGNKQIKYADFQPICPKDKPLFYTREECSIGGEVGANPTPCYEKAGDTQMRYTCDCPATFINVGETCAISGGGTGEPSGSICNFEGYAIAKYKYNKCLPTCGSLPEGEYMEDDVSDARACYDAHGDAKYQECSKNHVVANKCYCDTSATGAYKDKFLCLIENSDIPDENAKACSFGGKTYYTACQNKECKSGVPLSDSEVLCKNTYGTAAVATKCKKDSVDQFECICDTRTYSSACSYPLIEPTDTSIPYCIVGGKKQYQPGSCLINPSLDACGAGGYMVTNTESECKQKLGDGATAKMCEIADGANVNARKFNCYCDGEFKYTEDNCPINKLLTGGKCNGKYKSCSCHSGYKYNKYNCSLGILSGGSCPSKPLSSDTTIPPSLKDTEMPHFAYCSCPADYNKVCEGNNVGVGEACNGKYTDCKCQPTEPPLNWAQDYFSCEGGAKPTGVTQPDGCGGKLYQCKKSSCTFEHTEQCNGKEGVDGCQDDSGNVIAYKSCRCPATWKICSADKVGVGEPCINKGDYYYSNCTEQKTCKKGETLTCQGDLLLGVNPCTSSSGQTLFEYCSCAAGYDKICASGEVGEGIPCTLNGKKYYKSCIKPSTTCSPEHYETCDTNQEKYDPCVGSDLKLKYRCRCPSNWSTCAGIGAGDGAEVCKDAGRGNVYDKCKSDKVCSPNQESTYKICEASEIGKGESCVDSKNQVRHATCESTNECRINGYQHTCLGYDTQALGNDYCIDVSGNKLYKQCKCPSSWLPCSGKSNSKGTACTPVLPGGQPGTTVYSKCECDNFTYRYTCEASGKNDGVIAVEADVCIPYTYNATTGKPDAGKPLYKACSCKEGYNFDCGSNGQIKDDTAGYCQKVEGGQKLYKSCACDANRFTQECKQSIDNPMGPGMMAPSDPSKKCVPILEGGKDGTPLYTSCACGSYYQFTCTGNGQKEYAETNTDFCIYQREDGGSEKRYRYCGCSDDFSRTCLEDGGNKGIQPPEATSYAEKCDEKKFINGKETTIIHYRSCTCKRNYNLECKDDKFATNTVDYCMLDSVDGETNVKYPYCRCRDDFNQTCSVAGNPNTQPPTDESKKCTNVNIHDNSTVYQEDSCRCDENEECSSSVYPNTAVSAEGSDVFNLDVANKCGFAENYLFCDSGCGEKRYKCAIPEWQEYKYSVASCKKKGTDSGVPRAVNPSYAKTATTSKGTLTLYKYCDCNTSEFPLTEGDCNSRTQSNSCAYYGHDGSDGSGWRGGEGNFSFTCAPTCFHNCPTGNVYTLDTKSGLTCVDESSNTTRSKKCKCDAGNLYETDHKCYSWDRGRDQWCLVCRDEYGLHVKRFD